MDRSEVDLTEHQNSVNLLSGRSYPDKEIDMYLDSHLVMPANHPEAKQLMGELTRPNPKYIEAVNRGAKAWAMPQYIREYRVKQGMAYLPRYVYNLLDEFTRNQVEDRTSWGENPGKHFLNAAPINLRDYQREPVNEILRILQNSYGVTLQALMGTGKTVAALEVIRRLKLKTIVLVHTEFLMKQWAERAKEFLGEEVGFLQSDNADTSHSITVGTIQSIDARDYEGLRDKFGFVVVDETHRAAAPVFSSVIQKFTARFRLGMSATVERADEQQWIFYSHISPPVVTMERTDDYKMDPIVQMYRAPHLGIGFGYFIRGGNFSTPAFISAISEHDGRNKFLVKMIVEAAIAGRNIIVFSDRREHLQVMAELFEDGMAQNGQDASYGFLVGGMKSKDRDVSQGRQVIFCTYQLASEALDIPRLDTAFLATPAKGNKLQQSIGRIERMMEGKKQPMVIDLVDQGYKVANRWANARLDYYNEREWVVE